MFSNLFFNVFIFIRIGIAPAQISVHHVCAWQSPEEVSNALEVELQRVVI